jgi:class 3 adenylate cyclase
MGESESRVLTILLTDIRNFTDRTSRSSRSDVVGLIEKNKQLVLPSLQKRGGRLIKTIGDAFLVVFNSPTDAVLAGIDAQSELTRYNDGKPDEEKIEIRIAINVGEVSLVDNDVYGEAVNITSRIEGVAQAGEVFFTEAVYLAMNKTEVPSSEVGYLQLKGVPEKIRVYKVRREAPVGAEAPPKLLEEKGAKAWSVPAAPPIVDRRKKERGPLSGLIPIIVLIGVFGPRLIEAVRGD